MFAAVHMPLFFTLSLLPAIQCSMGTARAMLRPLASICTSSPNFFKVNFGLGSNVSEHGPVSPWKKTSRSIVACFQALLGTYTEQSVTRSLPDRSLYCGTALLVKGESQVPVDLGEGGL